jgi:hypothetical protein
MCAIRLGVFMLLLVCFCAGQTPVAGRSEKIWAVFHPVAAIKVKRISRNCNVLYSEVLHGKKLDTLENGGKMDAFRHVFYMAAFAQKILLHKLRKLGEAHERSNYRAFLKHKNEYGGLADSISSVMDLRNNDLGLALGCNYRSVTLTQLKELATDAVLSGKGVIIRRNSRGYPESCHGVPVDENDDRGKWNRERCLVRSDHVPG